MSKKSRKANREANRRKRESDRQLDEHLDKVAEASAISMDDQIKAAQAEAEEGGKYGVLVIGLETVEISPKVPFGRVWVAGSQAAADKLPLL